MFDVPMTERARRMTAVLETLRGAFTGEPFTHHGRLVHITRIVLGGSSPGAARRAARLADGFLPTDPQVWEVYRTELGLLGRPDPGPSPIDSPSMVVPSADPERTWREIGPYLLHHVNSYGRWQAGTDTSSPYREVADVDALRATGMFRVLTPDELRGAGDGVLSLHPLCGGIPPDLAWESLQVLEDVARVTV